MDVPYIVAMLEELGKVRPIFSGKRDFRDSLAALIERKGFTVETAVRQGDGHQIDILVTSKDHDYPIFLFYKVANIDVDHNGVQYFVADHSTAETIALRDFHDDMEQLKEDKGYIVFLTNVARYRNKDWGCIPDTGWKEYSKLEGKGNTSFIYAIFSGLPKKIEDHDKKFDYIGFFNDFHDFAEDDSADGEAHHFFYRGQRDLKFILLPKALRDDIPDYERKVLYAIQRENPDEYLGLTNLQKLTKMQHKTIPTRLVDISENPLVALFFAVSSISDKIHDDKWDEDRKDGAWVMRFSLSDGIKEFDSSVCRILAALATLREREKTSLRCQALTEYFIHLYSAALCHGSDGDIYERVVSRFHSWIDGIRNGEKGDFSILNKRFSYQILQIPDVDSDEPSESAVIFPVDDLEISYGIIEGEVPLVMLPSDEMKRLCHKVLLECPSFSWDVSPLSILDGVFVKPVFNSDRMVAQQGSFMLFGLSAFWNVRRMVSWLRRKGNDWKEIMEIMLKDSDDFMVKSCMEDYFESVLSAQLMSIKSDDCRFIKDELRRFGISKSTMGRSDETAVYELVDRWSDDSKGK